MKSARATRIAQPYPEWIVALLCKEAWRTTSAVAGQGQRLQNSQLMAEGMVLHRDIVQAAKNMVLLLLRRRALRAA